MGISFKGNANSFWRTNEAELEYIYSDFRKKARELKARYHPDREDGDAEIYRKFVNGCDLVNRQFERRGVIKLSAAELQERKELAHERHRARNRVVSRDRERRIRNGTYIRSKRGSYAKHRPHSDCPATLAPPIPSTVKFTPIDRVRLDKKAAQARARRRKNRKAFRAYRRALYHKQKATGKFNTPEFRAYSAARSRHYNQRHKRKIRKLNRLYRHAHPEKVKEWKENYKASLARRGIANKPLPEFFAEIDVKRNTPGTPEYERRRIWRNKNRLKHRDRLNAKRRLKYKEPRLKDHKGRFLPAPLATAA